VEQQSPPWRVFDAPAGQGSAADRGGRSDGAPAATGLAAQPLVLAAIGGAILIGALAVVVALGSAGAPDVAGPEGIVGESAQPLTGAGELVIDVAGAVVAPGVYRLAPGARIGDAIDAAGGFSPRVDAERAAAELNLAATLADGQQVRVPSRDDDAPIAGSGSSAGGGGGGGGAGGSSALVDLNRATQAELESLPGIGPVTAGKIIEARAQSPFKTIDELRERGLVGQKTFDSLRALITVG
jgi:competence protein ComEA